MISFVAVVEKEIDTDGQSQKASTTWDRVLVGHDWFAGCRSKVTEWDIIVPVLSIRQLQKTTTSAPCNKMADRPHVRAPNSITLCIYK